MSIHAPIAPPHFQGLVGSSTSCAQRRTHDVVKESIAAWISSTSSARREKSRVTTQTIACWGLGLRPEFPPQDATLRWQEPCLCKKHWDGPEYPRTVWQRLTARKRSETVAPKGSEAPKSRNGLGDVPKWSETFRKARKCPETLKGLEV